MKNTQKNLTRALTRGAAVAALYTALTLVSALFGLSSGAIQLRLSESLCLLPLVMPEATLGLYVGCMISNLITGCAVWDIIFGSLATLIGAYLGRLLYLKLSVRPWVATLPTVLANAVIVPFVLMFAYGAEGGYLYFFATVGIGELLSATLIGTVVHKKLTPHINLL